MTDALKVLRQLGLDPVSTSFAGIPSIARTFVEQQIDLYEVMMKQAPAAAFMRQQALLIDMTLSALKLQKRWRRRT